MSPETTHSLWQAFWFLGAVILVLCWLAWAVVNYMMEPYQPFSPIPREPYVPPPPPKPKLTRDFGAHFDPITNRGCESVFELLDSRELMGQKVEQCWQCPKCKLLRFEFEVKQ